MKTYTITQDTLDAIIDMLYSWCNTCIVDIDKLEISSTEDTYYFNDVSDMIGNIANNTAITLETLI